jgi:hypothetical protein
LLIKQSLLANAQARLELLDAEITHEVELIKKGDNVRRALGAAREQMQNVMNMDSDQSDKALKQLRVSLTK